VDTHVSEKEKRPVTSIPEEGENVGRLRGKGLNSKKRARTRMRIVAVNAVKSERKEKIMLSVYHF